MASLRNLLCRILCKQDSPTIREFESVGELTAFILTDWTNLKPYIAQDHDCDDFAREFQRAALRSGYLVNVHLADAGAHMRCMAIIQDEIYFIEPQTDLFWKYGPLD